MKHLAFSIVATATIMLSACAKEDTPDNPVDPEPPTDKLKININPSVVESLATDTGFENGDKIGLYVVNYSGSTPGTLANSDNHVDNMCFTYNGQWTPSSPIYWKDRTTHADFYLYYPYVDVTSVGAHAFSVRTDQSALADYKASDFMVGKASDLAPTASAIAIPANHVMSRIAIDLQPGNGFTAQSLASATISVKVNGVKCSSTIDLATGAVTPTGSASSVTPLYKNNTYKALIVPQTVEECDLITINVDGRDFIFRKAFDFEGGKDHTFTVTLSKTSNGVNVEINPWVDDGTDNGGIAE